MATRIDIPINTPGAAQGAGDVAKLTGALTGAEVASKKLAQTHDATGRSLVNVTRQVEQQTAEVKKATHAHEEHGISAEKTARKLSKLGETAHAIGEAFTGPMGAVGIAIAAVGTIGEVVGEQLKEHFAAAVEEVKTLAEEYNKFQEMQAKGVETQRGKALAGLEKNGDTLAALISTGGRGAVERSAALAKETGQDLDAVNRASVAGARAGLSPEATASAIRGAAMLSSQGRGKFDELAKSGLGLPADMLRGDAAEVGSSILNASQIAAHNSPEAQAKDRRDFDYEQIARQNLAEKQYRAESDRRQALGLEPLRYDAPRPQAYQRSRFVPAGGTSADDLRQADRYIASSEEGRTIQFAAQERAGRQVMEQEDSLRHGSAASTAATADARLEAINPNFKAALEDVRAKQQKAQVLKDAERVARGKQLFDEGKTGALNNGLSPINGKALNFYTYGNNSDALAAESIKAMRDAEKSMDALMKAFPEYFAKFGQAVEQGARAGTGQNAPAVKE